MRKKVIIVGGALLLILGILAVTGMFRKSKSQQALQAYIAELHANGEVLTWEELGSPTATVSNAAIDSFQSAVSRLAEAKVHGGQLKQMQFVEPGVAQTGWLVPQPYPSVTWSQFVGDMNRASNALAEVREVLAQPDLSWALIGTNIGDAKARVSFVVTREAAQALAADALAALHGRDLGRARADLRAITQLVESLHQGFILVNSMMGTAVAGLGLNATWEALQLPAWKEDELARLQSDWEAIDPIASLERAIVTERVWIRYWFEHAPDGMGQFTVSASSGAGFFQGLSALGNDLRNRAGVAYWHLHREEDQLFYLQIMQAQLDLIRQLQTNAPFVRIAKSLREVNNRVQSTVSTTLGKYRHLLTAIGMPNLLRAIETTVRVETQRRMTVIVIALKRYHLEEGRYPETLDELRPRFLTQTLLDPMSGRPFGYHTNLDGSFTLYSSGEDGIDDGGDPNSAGVVNSVDLWSGRDAVWPRAVTNAPGAAP